MIIVLRIIHVKGDRRLNVTNKFKYQRRLSSRLAIDMFRGTPCIRVPEPKQRGSFLGLALLPSCLHLYLIIEFKLNSTNEALDLLVGQILRIINSNRCFFLSNKNSKSTNFSISNHDKL